VTRSIASHSNDQGHAVVLFPHGQAVNGTVAKEIWKYCASRRYEFVALVRDWPAAARYLGTGHANVIVMPSEELAPANAGHGGDTVRLWPAEASQGESTRDLDVSRRRAVGNSRFISGRLPRERMREVMDGRGEGIANEVAVYRAGYSDGYLDCATLKGQEPQDL
jgi:hypothetical protein